MKIARIISEAIKIRKVESSNNTHRSVIARQDINSPTAMAIKA